MLFGLSVSLKSFFYRDCCFVLSSPPFFSTVVVVIFFRILRIKYIVDVRDLYPQVMFDLKIFEEKSLIGITLKKLESIVYKGAEEITVATMGLSDYVTNLGFKPVTIFNGYTDNFHYSESKKSNFTIVFHGNLGKLYDVEMMLDLAKLLENDDVDFLFIGDGDKVDLVKNCNLRNVIHLDRMPIEKVAKEVRSSHYGIVFLNKSDMCEKILPVKALEFIGCKLPFISYPKTEIDLLLNHEEDYSNKVEFLIRARSKILASKINYRSLSYKGCDKLSRIIQAQSLFTILSKIR